MKVSEKWGDSIEAAVEFALQDLKLTRDQVVVTVLEEPSKGFFGIHSKLAKVRVEEKTEPKKAEPKKVEPKAEAKKPEIKPELSDNKNTDNSTKKKPAKKKAPKQKKKENKEAAAPGNNGSKIVVNEARALVSAKPDNLVPVEEHPAKDFLEKTFKEMGLELSVAVAVNEDNVYVDVDGKDTGTVIGKRGQTLDAIQYLTSLVVNKGENEYIRVIVDAEGYRAKREATLEKLAYRIAEKVVKNGKSFRLEPMNPYERKVIHSTLQGVEGVNTRSEGDEPYRRVVIEPKR